MKSELFGDARDLTLGHNVMSRPPMKLARRQSSREIVSLKCTSYAVTKIEKNRRASSARRALTEGDGGGGGGVSHALIVSPNGLDNVTEESA